MRDGIRFCHRLGCQLQAVFWLVLFRPLTLMWHWVVEQYCFMTYFYGVALFWLMWLFVLQMVFSSVATQVLLIYFLPLVVMLLFQHMHRLSWQLGMVFWLTHWVFIISYAYDATMEGFVTTDVVHLVVVLLALTHVAPLVPCWLIDLYRLRPRSS